MRYVKGSIALNPVNDHAVLRHVLRCRHVSHEQLWQFLQLNGHLWPRRTLNWRIQRLVEHGLVVRSDLSFVSGVAGLYDLGPWRIVPDRDGRIRCPDDREQSE